jgi:hypothetical protein
MTTQSDSSQKGTTVTTVSVKIERIGSDDRLYLHNGTRGPATTVFQAIYHGCIDGTVIGSWSPAHVDATTSGIIVRAALKRIKGFDPTCHRDGDEERLAAFLDQLQDDAGYEVHAVEA